ncbi:MAG: ammonium transporter [bacterium]|nr:MAG: ammonium transporter [bacterium]
MITRFLPSIERVKVVILALMLLAIPAVARADALDSGDTAWMITATALVLFMTIPGLSLFYGGLVRAKNMLSVLMQCFSITALMTILWVVAGYSISFGEGGKFFGDFSMVFLRGIGPDAVSGTIPTILFAMFQLTFAIITPALIVGAFAERMKFSAMLLFTGAWMLLIYSPVCHWVWGGGWLGGMGALDFAGGTVVHINAGIAGLVSAIVLGKRKGYPTTPMMPHSLTLSVVGAGMLWVGWFGFNAGSELAADGTAGMALAVTQIATAAATLAWMFVEWIKHGKPSALGAITGAVAGLVAITPASGFVGPMGAIAIGFASGIVCFFAATSMKRAFGYDDSLDAFGVHGVGGMVGALLTGVFAAPSLGGYAEVSSIGGQLWIQFVSVTATLAYSAVGSFILLKAVDLTVGLRVTEDEEVTGLDITQHNEKGYDY